MANGGLTSQEPIIMRLSGLKMKISKCISEINFINLPKQRDIIEIVIFTNSFGNTSITLCFKIKNNLIWQPIFTIEKLVFVDMYANDKEVAHGKKEITFVENRLK